MRLVGLFGIKTPQAGDGRGDFKEAQGSQGLPEHYDRSSEQRAAGRGASGYGDGDGGQRGSASLPEDEDGDDGVCVSQTQAGRESGFLAAEGGRGGAGLRGLQTDVFREPGENSGDLPHCNTEQVAGLWAQTENVYRNAVGVNSDEPGSQHRSWLDMDRVDPCQPTQSHNVGGGSQQGGSAHWSGVRSGRVHPICMDRDEYVE